MNEVIYKIRVNLPCRLFIDDEEMMILDENKLAKITLPEGEYLRKVVAIDNKVIYDEAEITLSGASKLDNITLDTTGLEEAKHNALPKEPFQVGDLMYKALEDGNGVAVAKYVDKNITEVVIPEEILYGHYIYEVKEIGNRAFYECKGLASITIPNSITSLGEWAFRGCSCLTSITIPNSVTSIGSLAFSHCSSLKSVTIPNSVTSIGTSAFLSCSSLTSIVVEEGNLTYDNRENCNAIIETATNTLISGCQNTIIPNSVTSIENSAFSGCSGLTSVTIPNNVTSIGSAAFRYCKSLTSVIIPNSVTSIGDRAFYECSSLTSITIPNSVTSIGEWAFSGCSSLTSITIPNSVTSIRERAFSGCSGLTFIVVEEGNLTYDSRENCNALIETATNILIRGCQNTIIPNSVTSIGNYAFSGCSALTFITIPNGVTSIGFGAFYYCFSLTSVTIPNSVTSIGDKVFSCCFDLTSITIPNSVTSIGEYAFSLCEKLISVTVPSHTEIKNNAFPDHTEIIRK